MVTAIATETLKNEEAGMDRIKGKTAAIAGFFLVLVLILFTAAVTVYSIAGNRSLLSAEMRRHSDPGYSGLPDEWYPEMGKMIADYLTGRLPVFQFNYTDREGKPAEAFHPYESAHMEDCRRLILWAGELRWILGGAALVLIGTGIIARRKRNRYSAGMLAGLFFSAGICTLILGWGLISFDSLFIAFHRLFFTNDGWLLDTQTDMLIRLMPTSFFVSMGTKVLLAVAGVALAGFAAALIIHPDDGKQR